MVKMMTLSSIHICILFVSYFALQCSAFETLAGSARNMKDHGVMTCPYMKEKKATKCPYAMIYENIDGTCNNQVSKDAGSPSTPLKRYLPAEYGDGIQSPRLSHDGRPLPSARIISNAFNEIESGQTASSVYSHMFVQMGQFLAHDTVLTPMMQEEDKSDITCDCESTRPECIVISVPENDAAYAGKRTCIPMVRSRPVPGTSCIGNPRQQMNAITAYLDGNTIYGSNGNLNSALRDPESDRGELLTRKDESTDEHDPRTDSIPFVGQIREDLHSNFACPSHLHANKDTCLASGEKRLNENVGLTSMHILFMREHNRIARKLKELNPTWSSDDTFFETRRVIAAITQAITFKEFVPALVGPKYMKLYELSVLKSGFFYGYDATYDASISNVFATAAFRYGHSMVKDQLSQLNSFYKPEEDPIPMDDAFFNPNYLFNVTEHRDAFLFRGLLEDAAEKADTGFVDNLRNKMFLSETKVGVDLVSLNTERGREHGLPGYNKWRKFCGLKKAIRFTDLISEIPEKEIKILSTLYKNVNDIDLFIGALAETPVEGGAVGPTFACLNAAQFRDIKKGDRMWFENPEVFTYEQLREMRKASFARILCDNVIGMELVQPDTMYLDSVPGNAKIPCDEIPEIDLNFWKSISLSHDNGLYTRWFAQEADESNIQTLQRLLVQQPTNVCPGPVDYQIESFQRADADKYVKRIRFKCNHGTVSASDVPKVIAGYSWTIWFDRDSPNSSQNRGDDDESLRWHLFERPQDVCSEPIQIQAKIMSSAEGIDNGETLETFSTTRGLVCRKSHQPRGDCSDYSVRFLCPDDFFSQQKLIKEQQIALPGVEWTMWMNLDSPDRTGDYESSGLAQFLGYVVCRKPLIIEARIRGTDVSAEESDDVFRRYGPLYGLVCINEDQSNGVCNDYEVRYLCKRK